MRASPFLARLLPLAAALALTPACGGDSASSQPDENPLLVQGGAAGAAGGAGASGKAGQGAAGQGGVAGQGGSAGGGASGKGGAGGLAGTGGQAGAAGTAGLSGQGGVAGQGGAAGQGGQGGAGGAAGLGGQGGAAGCAACTQPGQICVSDACVTDCRQPGAVACGAGTACDVGSDHTGQCVSPDAGCVVTNAPEACGAKTCGPGSSCGPSGQCLPALPCTKLACSGAQCWGEECSCTRPASPCMPAPLGAPGEVGTLNDPLFLRTGTHPGEGAVDLDFDPSCNAWAVTFISGPDYLRKIDPKGVVSSVTGVTNLNMGEVAVLQGKDGQFGGGFGDVALTYICCETCGCILTGSDGNPQGAAVLDAATSTLPMKIPSVDFTSGAGPFGQSGLDTGPYGLTWGLDRTLYLGNVKQNGDFVALDLAGGSTAQVAQFDKRVNAATPFDHDRILVALEGGEVLLVPIFGLSGDPKPLITLPANVTSIARDSWSGDIYASLSDFSLVRFRPGDTDPTLFNVTDDKGRLALARDGYLYFLGLYPVDPYVVRFALPTTFLPTIFPAQRASEARREAAAQRASEARSESRVREVCSRKVAWTRHAVA